MYIPYEEFEKVMSQCHEVFTSWDDEYDELKGLMGDIMKKKGDEHLRMVWQVNFSHKMSPFPFLRYVLNFGSNNLTAACSISDDDFNLYLSFVQSLQKS